MYAVLPFTIFLAPPLVGFLADKMGSYTRSLILTLIGSGIFHTGILFKYMPIKNRTDSHKILADFGMSLTASGSMSYYHINVPTLSKSA